MKFSLFFFVLVVAHTFYFSGQGVLAQTKLSAEPENPPGYVAPAAPSAPSALPTEPGAPPAPPLPDSRSSMGVPQQSNQPDTTLPQSATAPPPPVDVPYTTPGQATPPPSSPPPINTYQDPGDLSRAANANAINKNDQNSPAAAPAYPVDTKPNLIINVTARPEDKKLFALVKTSEGSFKFKLFPQYAPKTVKNFIDLATGQKEFVEAATSRKSTRPFYNGQIIFKVVRDFVIQMGCPFGDGRGGPGYEIPDEFSPYLHHDKAGMVSMANHGPNTAGSQFFITLAPQKTFDDKYTVFGQVVSGMDVVTKISKIKTGPTSRPLKRIVIQKIEIEGL